MMDAEDGQQAMHPQDCSGGPVAARRRISSDGSSTVSERRQRNCRQSSNPEATDWNRMDSDESLDTSVASSGSGDSPNILVIDSHISDAEKRRSAPSEASGASGDEKHEKDVDSETSESSKRPERGEPSERGSGATSGKDTSEISDGGSGSDVQNLSPSIDGSTDSLVEHDLSNENASEALDEKKERVDSVITIIAGDVSKISQLTFKFYTVATIPLGKFISSVENRDSRRPGVRSDEFEERLDAIKAYVHGFCTETRKQEANKSLVAMFHKFLSCDRSSMIDDITASEARGIRATRRPVRQSYSVRWATNSIRKSLNVVVSQRKLMSQLCALAQRFASKAEISCQLILDCLKTILIMLTQAVRACLVMDTVVRCLDGEGRSFPWFSDAASLAANWTSEALLEGEMAMHLHEDAIDALKATSSDLEDMKGYQQNGAQVLRDTIAIGERFLNRYRQSNVNVRNIKQLESNMKTMRFLLTPHLSSMKKSCIHIKKWSSLCDDTLSIVLRTLSLVTENSCNTVDEAMKAVEYIYIRVGISLQ